MEVVGVRGGGLLAILESKLRFREAYEAGFTVTEIAQAASLHNSEALELIHSSGAKMRRFGGGRGRKKIVDTKQRVGKCREILFAGV